jgi:hypothetical protein
MGLITVDEFDISWEPKCNETDVESTGYSKNRTA